MINLPGDGSEDLQLILSACKCLDTLLVLQTEEFQMLVLSGLTFHLVTFYHSHQCVFITDTVDAVYRPDDWFPEAMMDQLSEIAGSLPISVRVFFSLSRATLIIISFQATSKTSHLDDHSIGRHQQPAMRRPLLGTLRHIESMRDLVPFFSNVSLSSYESVYASGGNIDWEAVENSIMDDMFEGR